LGHEFLDRVLDQLRVAVIDKSGGKLPEDARPLLDLAEEQSPGI